MSEQTGATPEQIEAAVERAYATWGYGEGMPHVLGPEVRKAAKFIVPLGFKIVPADAVVVTPEVAATAAEACDSWAISCAVSARQEKSVGHHDVAEAAERRYAACKAAAAALRGEG